MFDLILDSVDDFHTVEERRLHRIFGGLLPPFYEHPWSISGKIIFSLAVSNLGWATLPLNDGFNPEDGFVDRWRENVQ